MLQNQIDELIDTGSTRGRRKRIGPSVKQLCIEAFRGNEKMADSVNHLLVVGFYLINFGYVTLALKLGYAVNSAEQSIEALSVKVGMVLLVLGGMHFFNLFIFSRMRRRTHARPNNNPPVAPDTFTAVNQEA